MIKCHVTNHLHYLSFHLIFDLQLVSLFYALLSFSLSPDVSHLEMYNLFCSVVVFIVININFLSLQWLRMISHEDWYPILGKNISLRIHYFRKCIFSKHFLHTSVKERVNLIFEIRNRNYFAISAIWRLRYPWLCVFHNVFRYVID